MAVTRCGGIRVTSASQFAPDRAARRRFTGHRAPAPPLTRSAPGVAATRRWQAAVASIATFARLSGCGHCRVGRGLRHVDHGCSTNWSVVSRRRSRITVDRTPRSVTSMICTAVGFRTQLAASRPSSSAAGVCGLSCREPDADSRSALTLTVMSNRVSASPVTGENRRSGRCGAPELAVNVRRSLLPRPGRDSRERH
jgi:hypothetical protein